MSDPKSDTKIDPRFKNSMFQAQTWKGYVQQYAQQVQDALEQVPDAVLDDAFRLISTAVRENRRVFVAGNGGSAAIADHLCCDWTKGTHSPGLPPLRTHSLASNVPVLTAIANDFGYDAVFSRQLEMLGSAGDVLLLISSSGNSPNILAAVDTAKAMGITTIGLTGFTGGALAPHRRRGAPRSPRPPVGGGPPAARDRDGKRPDCARRSGTGCRACPCRATCRRGRRRTAQAAAGSRGRRDGAADQSTRTSESGCDGSSTRQHGTSARRRTRRT